MTVGTTDLILGVCLLFFLMQGHYIISLILIIAGVLSDMFGSYI